MLRTGVKISGRVEFEGDAEKPAPDQLSRIPVLVEPLDGQFDHVGPFSGRIDAKGQFTTYGVAAGRYYIRIGAPPAGWTFKGAFLGDRDVSDDPLELDSTDVADVVITFTDRPASLAGTCSRPSERRVTVSQSSSSPQIRRPGSTRAQTRDACAKSLSPRQAPTTFRACRPAPTMSPPYPRPRRATGVIRRFSSSWPRAPRTCRSTTAKRPRRTSAFRRSGNEVHPHRLLCLILALGVLDSRSVAAQTSARDAAKPPAVGTASITGTIVSDDADARPLRRVRVGVMTSDRQVSRTVVTDDEGRFNFVALPAGRYMLTANKQGYVTAAYGARRPNRPGTALVLADDQRITGLTLRMTRGSAISGVLVDHNGEPFSGANVSAMRNQFVGTGQRSLLPVASAVSDDRGHYRLWGLAAGDYVISANAGFAAQTRDNDIARLTDADIKRALSEVASGSARPGGPSDASADPEVRPRTVGYAAVFYPGTSVATKAIPIKLGAAEERTGVDFPMALVHTAKIEGLVVVPEGVDPQTVLVQLIGSTPQGFTFDMFRRSVPAKDGVFGFAGVPPGPYAILAQSQQPPVRPTGPLSRLLARHGHRIGQGPTSSSTGRISQARRSRFSLA